MNYWLDLNHVASEGARKGPSTRSPPTASTTRSSGAGWRPASCAPAARPRSRLPATVAICLPGGADVGDPVKVQVAVAIQPAVHRQDDQASRQRHDAARAAGRLRREAEPAHERGARHSRLAAREDGGILVFVALLIPVVLLFLSLSVDIGNWWVHKRHLQLQVDAAAFAGGALLGECFTDCGGREHRDQERGDAVRRRRRARATTARSAARTRGRSRSSTRARRTPVGAVDPDDTETQPPCDTPDLMLDVKASEAGLPLIFQIPGLPNVGRDQRACARAAEVGRGAGRAAARRRSRPPLHVRLRDLRQRGHRCISRDGAADRRPARAATISSGPRRAAIPVSIASAHVGVRLRLVGGVDPNCRLRSALHGVLRRGLDERRRPHPRLEHGHRADGSQRLAASRLLRSRTRTSRSRRLQRAGSRPRSTSARRIL